MSFTFFLAAVSMTETLFERPLATYSLPPSCVSAMFHGRCPTLMVWVILLLETECPRIRQGARRTDIGHHENKNGPVDPLFVISSPDESPTPDDGMAGAERGNPVPSGTVTRCEQFVGQPVDVHYSDGTKHDERKDDGDERRAP